MADKQTLALLDSGYTKTVTLDPTQKDAITKNTLNEVMRDVKSGLLKKRKVHIIMVTE